MPEPLWSWLDVVTLGPGSTFAQGAAAFHRGPAFVDYAQNAEVWEWTLDQPGGWRLLDPNTGPVRASGRLIGGCVETVSMLAEPATATWSGSPMRSDRSCCTWRSLRTAPSPNPTGCVTSPQTLPVV